MSFACYVRGGEVIMKKSERSSYTPIDFQDWQAAGSLVISPKFQRRGVWSRAAKSYLIDTLLLGLPVPPIYLRVTQSKEKKKIIREVVDGQQRVSTVLEYIQDSFPLYKNIESDCVGKYFSELTAQQQDAIQEYSFVSELFYGVEDRDILRIFARLNTHSVKLNAQELRNGQFFGAFKQSAYALALEHLEYWRAQRLFSEMGIARMSEVELTSELLIAMIDGMQDKKKSIDSYYEQFEDRFPGRARHEANFRHVIDELNDAVSEGLSDTEFRRAPLFYSLFLAAYHRMFDLPGVELATPAVGKLTRTDRVGLRDAVLRLSDVVSAAKGAEASDVPRRYESFVAACLRQTDNLRPRRTRLSTIYGAAFG